MAFWRGSRSKPQEDKNADLPETIEYVEEDTAPGSAAQPFVVGDESVEDQQPEWMRRWCDRAESYPSRSRSRSRVAHLPVVELDPAPAQDHVLAPGQSTPLLAPSQCLCPLPSLRMSRSEELTRLWFHATGGSVRARLPAPGTDAFQHGVGIVGNQSCAFYIGITECPVTRWLGSPGMTGHRHNYCRMVVFLEARSSASTAELERDLIERFGQDTLR